MLESLYIRVTIIMRLAEEYQENSMVIPIKMEMATFFAKLLNDKKFRFSAASSTHLKVQTCSNFMK